MKTFKEVAEIIKTEEWDRLEKLILEKEGVTCNVLVKPHAISIRAETFGDYCLAKRAIKGSVTKPIERDE